MPGADCEYIVEGWLAQPVNAMSSLAFVLAGIWVPLAIRTRSGRSGMLGSAFGSSLALVGIGSLAFHGPGGTLAGWLHDASITALLILILTTELGRRVAWSARLVVTSSSAITAILMVIEWIWTGFGDALNAPLAFFAVLAVLGPEIGRRGFRPMSERNRGRLMGAALVGTGAIVMVLSRTGGPFCAPEALLQGHAMWHVLAALGIGVYAVSVLPVARPPRARQSSKIQS